RLGVEGAAVEHDLALLARAELFDTLVAAEEREHARARRPLLLVAAELGLETLVGERLVDRFDLLRRSALPALARLLGRRVTGFHEALLVERVAARLERVAQEVLAQPVGLVEEPEVAARDGLP